MRKLSLKTTIFLLGFWLVFGLVLYASAAPQSTSGVTAQTIIDRARIGLAETTASTSFWSDADLLRYTDQAVKEIAYRTKCLESAYESITLVANTWTYSLSSTTAHLDIASIIYDSGATTSNTQIFSLDRTDIKAIGHSKETGPPKVYTLWNDAVVIWPIPRSTEAGTTLYVYLDTAPTGVTATTSTIETPAYFDDAIVAYVKGQAFLKPGSGQEAFGVLWIKRFDSIIEEYVAKILKRVP